MASLNRSAKVLITVSLFALLVWITYWMIPSFSHFSNIIQGLPDQYTGKEWYFVPSHCGLISRLVAVMLGIAVSSNTWVRERPSPRMNRLVVAALVLEAVYWLSLLPSSASLLTRSPPLTTLGIAYLAQTILAAPLLLVLAVSMVRRNYQWRGTSLWMWAGCAFAGYVGALWANAVLRWVDMWASEGAAFFAGGVRSLGLFDSTVFMSLALAFAVAAAYRFSTHDNASARRWVGLALSMIGLHYVIYLAYSYLVGALVFAWLVDIWTVPVLLLGISLFFAGHNAR